MQIPTIVKSCIKFAFHLQHTNTYVLPIRQVPLLKHIPNLGILYLNHNYNHNKGRESYAIYCFTDCILPTVSLIEKLHQEQSLTRVQVCQTQLAAFVFTPLESWLRQVVMGSQCGLTDILEQSKMICRSKSSLQ